MTTDGLVSPMRVVPVSNPSPPGHGDGPPKRVFWLSDDDVPLVLFLLVYMIFACVVPAQSDTFYHLRSGRAMWETGWFLEREAFSHTARGQPLHNHWWLSQLLFYGLYSVGGPVLLSAAAGVSAFLALYLSWRLVRGSVETRIVLMIAFMLVLSQWSVRPQVFSMLLLMLVIRLVLANRLAWISPLFLVWANAHALVVLGILAAAAVVLEALVWSRYRLRSAILLALAAAAAPMLSPLGLHYWPRVIETVRESRHLGIHEYRSAFAAGTHALGFWILLAALAIMVLRARRRLVQLTAGERVLLLTSGLFALAAMVSVRNVAFFALVAVPALSRVFPASSPRRPRPAAGPAVALLAVAIVIGGIFVVFRWRDGGVVLGWRPIGPAAIAAIRACPGPMYNGFNEGGVLMWFVPEQPVFVDGRVEAYPAEFLRRAVRAGLYGEYQDLFVKYGVQCAAVRTQSRMADALRIDKSMRLKFADEQWSVFERVGPPPS
jgi:hypothetical protein